MQKPLDTSILDNLPIAIGIADFEGKIHYINKNFTELFGYKLKEIPTLKDWGKLAFPDEVHNAQWLNIWEETKKSNYRTQKTHTPDTFLIRCKDGQSKHIEITFNIHDRLLFAYFRDVSELHFSKEKVDIEKRFSNNIINGLPGVFYMFVKQADEYRLVRWNKNFENVLGYSPEEIYCKSPFDFIAPEDHEYGKKKIEDIFIKGHVESELRIKTKEGKVIPFLFASRPYQQGNRTYFLGQGINLSRQIEFQNNVKTLFMAFPDILIVADYQGNILYANDSLKQQTGYTQEYLQKNKGKVALHPPEDREMLKNKITELLSSNAVHTDIIENRFIDKKGQTQWYSGVIVKTTFSGQPALLTISRNITRSKYSEQALVESENRMSTVFDSAPVIMMLINEKREILQINKKGIQGLNLTKKDYRLLPFGEAYKCINAFENPAGCGAGVRCGDCVVRRTIQDTFTNGTEHVKVEATLHTKDTKYYILLSSALLKNDVTKEVLLTVDDVTEQRLMQEELKQSVQKAEESDRLKSAFLQNMSHEIRTPLNGILGFSGLLDSEELSPEERSYYIDVINQSSNQLLSIVDDILSISRLETGQIEVLSEQVNVNAMMQELFAVYNTKASERNIVISHGKELDDKQSIVFSDSEKLRQVLDNLLSNALKFTHEGHVKFGYHCKGNTLQFYIEDTGIGIKESDHSRIFERFQQVDFDSTRVYGGTGLGLTIAKGNTELLGGKIWLDSLPGKGSTFYFTLPYKPVYPELTPALADDGSTKDSEQPAILIAEDEEINYLFIAESLKEIDYKLLHAFNGLEAVELCKQNKSICLVLMDIKMPKLDGYSAFEEIKLIRPELPVIAQTAYAMVSDREKALKAGFKDYLSKPIKKAELLNVISKYLEIG
jgi:PAS domain S-box-containing protein